MDPCAGRGTTTILAVSIMKEFNCKVSSTWSNDDRTKDAAFTHRKYGNGGQEKLSQVDCIIGPKRRHDDCCSCNGEKTWDSCDHCPMYARIQEGRDSDAFTDRHKRASSAVNKGVASIVARCDSSPGVGLFSIPIGLQQILDVSGLLCSCLTRHWKS